MSATQSNVSLKPLTTFKIGGPAKFFMSAAMTEDFNEATRFLKEMNTPFFVLGGGSNLLVSDHGFDGLVIHPVRRGVAFEERAPERVALHVQAGEPWDEVVHRAVEEALWGIENLSHIPGQAGAALVQNIGAYGQQVSDVLESANVKRISDGASVGLSATDCGFGYRRSIFNSSARNEFIILDLTLLLTRAGKPDLRYPDVKAHFATQGLSEISLGAIRKAIIQIRDSKFPFPREEKGGNAGSFFKNLLLGESEVGRLEDNLKRNFGPREFDRWKQIRSRSAAPPVKTPAAFLIDICELKGHQVGGARINESQPLVILNQGGATAEDVLRLAGLARRVVQKLTGASLEIEPELVGFTPAEKAAWLGEF